MNNIEDNSEKFCTGCSACVAVCPVNAIEYKLNENGFYQAFVNKEKCINCGKCKKVCLKFENKLEEIKKLEEGILYSAQSKDENIVKSCTSGGIAYEISKYGIENGYKILGTIYDYEKNIARAIIAENIEEIELLKGSKYLQSNTEEAIKLLKERCLNNPKEKFIVFGTPCQIAGISKMIEVENIKNEIIKVDLFCHGVPSYLVWKKYLEELKEEYKIKKINKCIFRSKHYGWHQFCLEIEDGNKKNIVINSEKSNFYQIFFDNMFLNFSCYDCDVRKNKTSADIRLGDFWGKKYYDNLKGISAMLVMTENGKKILKKINNKIIIIEQCKIEECFTSQSIKKYNNDKFNNEMITKLKNKESLKTTIKEYRKKLPLKKQIKLLLKDGMGKISPLCKYKFKKIYYKLKKGE